MTREEAVKIINCYDLSFYDLSGEKILADKLAEAFHMATEALKADRPRGEWTLKMNERFYWKECSMCGHKPPRSDEYGTYIESNYCPNCGAKMDGGNKDER